MIRSSLSPLPRGKTAAASRNINSQFAESILGSSDPSRSHCSIRTCSRAMNSSCRRLPRRSSAKTGEPAGEAYFANRPHAFTGVATSRFMGSRV